MIIKNLTYKFMVYVIHNMDEAMKRGKVTHTVDDKTIIIGKDTQKDKVSAKDTERMLTERLDTMPKGEERSVYEKIFQGVKHN